jgi:hypothetical protein
MGGRTAHTLKYNAAKSCGSAPAIGYYGAMKWPAIKSLLGLACVVTFAGIAAPAAAGDISPVDPTCYWCIRDAIYADVALIDHLEANPDIDEAIKGSQIVAARADIHRLRALLGPLNIEGPEPCCYSRKTLVIR